MLKIKLVMGQSDSVVFETTVCASNNSQVTVQKQYKIYVARKLNQKNEVTHTCN